MSKVGLWVSCADLSTWWHPFNFYPEQGANYGPWCQTWPVPVFVNKVLLDHDHSCSLTACLQLLLEIRGWDRGTLWSPKLKIYLAPILNSWSSILCSTRSWWFSERADSDVLLGWAAWHQWHSVVLELCQGQRQMVLLDQISTLCMSSDSRFCRSSDSVAGRSEVWALQS